MEEKYMKEVMKKFLPGTKWADLAAFHLIDNKLCGDWQGATRSVRIKRSRYLLKSMLMTTRSLRLLAEAFVIIILRHTGRSALIEIYKK